jgi:phosphoglycolate phosphatase
MKPPHAIVFDLDGTLADTRVDIAGACNHTLAALGRPPRSVDDISGFVGDGARMLLARALETAPEGALVDEAVEVFSTYYPHHAADHAAWMPGALEALDACAGLAIQVALATNKPRSATLPLLDALGGAGRFARVWAGGDGPLKPDPASILALLRAMRVEPPDAWVVGDGAQDIGAGRAAGAGTVAVLGGFGTEASLRAAHPDRLLSSMGELPALLRELATLAAPRTPQ